MRLYYYVKDAEKVGPYTLEELKNKNIYRDTLVWYQGLQTWERAVEVDDLRPLFNPNTPPPINNIQQNLHQTSNQEKSVIPQEPQGYFSNPFGFEGRIRRSEFIISFIICSIYLSIIGEILGDPYSANVDDSEVFTFLFLIIPVMWFGSAQAAKRSHDIGNSGWLQLIPFYIFWLVFVDGKPFTTQYGRNPKK